MLDLETLRGRLIVSCQAPDGSPLRDPGIIAAIAEAAVLAGAGAVRINSAEHVAAVRERVTVPIIGLEKVVTDGFQWITPTVDRAKALLDAGADIIAVDATLRARGEHPGVDTLLPAVRELGAAVMADIDSFEAGAHAGELGADLVGTTLSGYTSVPQNRGGDPDIELVARLATRPTPVIAEGRIKSPEELRAAFEAGAFAVVVGTSITEPMALTKRYLAAVPTLTKGASA
ncbi:MULTISPECIES: N-acetylmannosamine-6-phosphate 2-epimerase [unclassified Microbacterium]|uniref:N-acetylmannosamine-6-phosphate 2-epimerase n=1 Tax=unclassified Microbacterium TaxID=2609290 RepID=UPI001604FAE3|nr:MULTISPECIES: putative N-acetylmannosamine-6-phosphate 2-epimerase [unclassified Microbacterium]QNA91263.1 putative N-acetylmannosamine-6-phosphate 2-epimerase [Microbacterium sp. Se63.02b]QYM64403.1 putative N-acetylmannosamine-6-phosphate 2-epimerase [Microbacterium sp. Se5.02b]